MDTLEIKDDEVNVEEIMSKIRENIQKRIESGVYDRKMESLINQPLQKPPEVVRMKTEAQLLEKNVINPEMHETAIWRFIKNTHYKLQKFSLYRLVFSVAVKFEKYIPKYKEYFLIEDFIKYHDIEFIKFAYRGLLNREPDPYGFDNYLSLLRKGQRNKIEILGALRYSKEGKERNIAIKGLYLRYLLNISYRIPILGYFIKLFISILRFPQILRNFQEFEGFTNARYSNIDARLIKTDARFTENDTRFIEIFMENNARFSNIDIKLNEHSKNLNNLTLETRNNHEQLVNTLSSKADIQSFNETKGELAIFSKQIRDNKLQILGQERRLEIMLEETRKRFPEPIALQQIENILKEEEHLLDAMYVTFENQFRGTREEIKERLKVYLPYIESTKAVKSDTKIIDIGSGRGEWLELLKENGYAATGIDINRMMIEQCKELGLDVIQGDTIEYLRKQETDSYGAITGFHIVEHIPYKTLISLLDETLRVLKPGGIAIFETPNPENIIVGACNFYMDPTHRNPIPPLSLQFLMEARGFEKTEIMKLHPYDYFQNDNNISEINIKLKTLFNMEQDYSVIAYKGLK